MYKRFLLVLAVLGLFGVGQASAQGYSTAAGLRLGGGNGLTVKHFVSQDAAIEGLLYSRWGGLLLTGLYEIHNPIGGAPGLRWFYGGGAHLGTWNSRSRPRWARDDRSYTIFGLDLIIGLDYKFDNAPINLSIDWKPAFAIAGYQGWRGDELALSLRFTF